MLTSQDVFRIYGDGSSSENESGNQQPLYTSNPKTVVTYLSESDSGSESSLSSLTSSSSNNNSEDKDKFRQAHVNGKQLEKPLRSALKKNKIIKCNISSTKRFAAFDRVRGCSSTEKLMPKTIEI